MWQPRVTAIACGARTAEPALTLLPPPTPRTAQYETDVSLPMYVMGPGVPAGAILEYPTTHIDITATIVELAGATAAGPPLDGLSFAAAFSASPPAPRAWRDFQFAEFHCNDLTWRQVRRPFENTTYAMWCDGTEEVFDLVADPWQLANVAATSGANISAADGPLAEAMWTCAGDACRAPTPRAVTPFRCYNVSGPMAVFDP
jgi:N-acetylglucosamine-6-sulfatase